MLKPIFLKINFLINYDFGKISVLMICALFQNRYEAIYGKNSYGISEENQVLLSDNSTNYEQIDFDFIESNVENNTQLSNSANMINGKVAKLLLIEIMIKHNLTQECVEDIMKFSNLISGQKLFSKKFKTLVNNLPNNSSHFNYYFICNCSKTEGPFSPKNSVFRNVREFNDFYCSSCGQLNNCKQLLMNNNYFLHLPLEPQIQRVLTNFNSQLRNSGNNKLNNIIDGLLLKEHLFPDYLSLTLGIDGVPVGHSSTNSIIPVICFINNLNPKLRANFPLITLIYSGNNKPNANEFLKPLVDEINYLNLKPISWTNSNSNKQQTLVTISCVICDAPARSWVQNITGHQSYYGCNWCTIKSILQSNTIRYNLTLDEREINSLLRTKEQTLEFCDLITDTNYKGIKGKSILSDLPNFDIIKCFSPELMHSRCLGIIKEILKHLV